MRRRKGSIEFFIVMFLVIIFGLFTSNVNCGAVAIQVTGVTIPASETSFINNQTIDNATDIKGNNANAGAIGVYGESNSTTPLDLFENTDTGSISAVAEIGNVTDGSNCSSTANGVYISDRNVGNFTNSGLISASATAGNASGNDSHVYAYVGDAVEISDVHDFTNSGNITAAASAGDALGDSARVDAEAYYGAVYIEDYVYGDFTNSGLISASATAGNASGSDSSVDAEVDYGAVYIDELYGDFTNSGLISASATAGNASGNGSSVNVYADDAVDIYNIHGNFTNTGTISATAQVGGALGDNSTVNISRVAGVYFKGDVNALNQGNIITSVKAGKDAEISSLAGLEVEGASSANIVNNGNIYINVDAPQAQSVNNAAGIYVVDSDNVTLSNPGAIYLWNNAPNADIRTLRIEDSTVTLADKFAVVFGQEGIDKKPIYVDGSSTLDLNNADLIARAGNRLIFGQPYYVIEKKGTVDGNFGNLLRGYQNSDILVNWYDSNRGADSAVTFSYQPKSSMPALGLHSSIAVVDTITNLFATNNMFSENLLAQTNNKVYFAAASNIATDAISPYKVDQKLDNAMFIYPFYGVVNGNNSLKYDARAKGFVAGYEHKFDDYMKLSLFGGYARGDVDFNIKGSDDENQNIYIAGFSLDKIAKQESPIYVGLTTIGYHTDHDYSGATGPNYEIPEKADYNSKGLEANLISGYKFFGNDWEIMPHIGAGLSYWHLSNFNTEALDPNWNRFYDSANSTYGKLMAGLSGIKNWNVKENQIYLTGLLRAQEVIGNNDFSIAQELPYLNSGKVGVTQSISNFSLIGRVELGLKIKKYFLIGLSSGTELNADYKAYDGRMFFSYSF